MYFIVWDFIVLVFWFVVDGARDKPPSKEYYDYIQVLMYAPSISMEDYARMVEHRFPPKPEPTGLAGFVATIFPFTQSFVEPHYQLRCLSPHFPIEPDLQVVQFEQSITSA
jgi:hypothetical protein